MPSFGIIVLHEDQEQTYYRDIARAAARCEMTVHRFVPTAIDPYTERVNGETFNTIENQWQSETFPIPDVLYDRCFYATRESFKTNAPVVEWLKNRTAFLGFGLPSKTKVHESLENDPYLGNYTIETIKADSYETMMRELNNKQTILLKPETGSQGKGIFVIQKKSKGFVVKTDRRGKTIQKSFPHSSALKEWFDRQLLRTSFLIQPFLTLQNKRKQPFDIRVLMHKDEHGRWTEGGRGLRIGVPGALVSNLHSTGRIVNFDQWLSRYPSDYRGVIVDEVEGIIEHVPQQLERTFGPLYELGLDIGIDTHAAVWLLEANSKPGHQTVLRGSEVSPEQIAMAPLKYAQWLLEEKEKAPLRQSDTYPAQDAHSTKLDNDEGIETYAKVANTPEN